MIFKYCTHLIKCHRSNNLHNIHKYFLTFLNKHILLYNSFIKIEKSITVISKINLINDIAKWGVLHTEELSTKINLDENQKKIIIIKIFAQNCERKSQSISKPLNKFTVLDK